MSSSANIALVTVDGSEVSRDYDLDPVPEFEFVTDEHNSYRVVMEETESERM